MTLGPVGKLLSDPARWTKRVNARDESGHGVNPKSGAARRWCLVGAVGKMRVSDKYERFTLSKLRTSLPAPWVDISSFNDHPSTTHTDIMALLEMTGV